MTVEEKKAEDGWQSKDLWYKLNANESTYKTGFQDGYKEALKMKVNITSISDAPLMERERLKQAEEIIKAFLLMAKVEHLKDRYETVDEAEQFLKE